MEFSATSPAVSDDIGAVGDYSLAQLFPGQPHPPADATNNSYVANAIRSAISSFQHADAFIRFICDKQSILESSDLSFYAEAIHDKHHCSHVEMSKIESTLKDQIAASPFIYARWKTIVYSHLPHILANTAKRHPSSISPPQIKKPSAVTEFCTKVEERLWSWCGKSEGKKQNETLVAFIKQQFYNTDAKFKPSVIIRQSEQNIDKFHFFCPCCPVRLELDSVKPQIQSIYRHVGEVHLGIPRDEQCTKEESDATSSSEAKGRRKRKPYATTGLRQKQTRLSSDLLSAAPASSASASTTSTVVPPPGPLPDISNAAAAEVSASFVTGICCN